MMFGELFLSDSLREVIKKKRSPAPETLTVLVSYDVEAASIGEGVGRIGTGRERYNRSFERATTAKALEIISEIHSRYEAPFTTFVTGKTLLQAVEPYRKAVGELGKLIDVEQHTFSHVQFKDISFEPSPGQLISYPAGTTELLEQEVKSGNEAVRRALGLRCRGIRTPFCYWQGLRGEKRKLEILRDNGLRFVSSFARNRHGGQPTPWVQPYTYEGDGFPEMVELPVQSWFDGMWYSTFGWENTEAFKKLYRKNLDYVHRKNLVWGIVFHEWILVEQDEPRTKVVQDFIKYAKEKGEEMLTNLQFSEVFRKQKGSERER
jgi:peptidoglycan/xylan/chitin deacetylase (PgdA/CDA1 family)